MNIDQLFIESCVLENDQAQRIIKHFAKKEPIVIESVDHYFGKTKKPYLQKRTQANVYIGKKRGQKIKLAPDAYGHAKEPHFYFIHAYNCIYECSYCYLQGYFDSPDLVFFVNHDEVVDEIRQVANSHNSAWFHAGEFSDSLALSHITQEWGTYFELFKTLPNHKLELRTKSCNVKHLSTLTPLPNVYVSFSVSPELATKNHDLKTPSLNLRLKAMQDLVCLGHPIALHLDPMIYSATFKDDYEQLVDQIFHYIKPEEIHYVSLGTVRFTKDVYRATQQNYPDSSLHHQKFQPSHDQILRYPKPLRFWMMGHVQELFENRNLPKDKIYWCME